MADNETKIRLTAVDDVTAKLNSIKGAAADLTGSFTRLQGALGAIGVSAAVGGLVASVSAAVQAADAMDELSQKTGVAVDQLSALDYAMRREGVSTESFGRAVKELSKNMVEAGDASSKTGKLLAELGVNAQGSTRDALLKIADTFAAIPDGATKASLAVQLFGKAGMDLIPALNNGAEGIRQLEEQARRLGVTIDGDTARSAAKLKDDLFALGESSKALGNSIAKDLVGPLKDITAAMREAVEQGGLLQALWVGLGGIGNLILNGSETTQVRNEIANLTQQIEGLEAAAVNAEGKQLANLIKALDELNPKLEAAKKRLADLTALPAAPAASGGDKERERQIAKLLGGDGAKATIDTFAKALESLENKLDSAASGFSSDFAPAVEILNQALAKGAISLARHEDLMAKLVKLQPIYKAGVEAEAKAEEQAAKIQERRNQLLRESQQAEVDAINGRDAVLDALEDSNALLRQEIETLGMTTLERELYLLKLEEERDLKSALTDEDEGYIRSLYREKAALLEARAARTESMAMMQRDWDTLGQNIASGFSSIFADMLDGGITKWSDFTKRLGDIFKRSVVDFAGTALQQLFRNLASGLSSGNFSGLMGGVNPMGLVAAGGGILGGLGAQALGAGQRGVQAGSILGTLFGGIPGAILGKLIDPDGPAERSATFGPTAGSTNPTQFGFTSAFGQFSISDTKWFSDKDMGAALTAFFQGLARADNGIAAFLSPEERARVTGALSGSRGYSFGTEGTDFSATLGEITLDRMRLIFDALDPSLTKLLDGFTGTNEELVQFVTGILQVRSALATTPIKGLTLESLAALKVGNETVVDTFNRINAQWTDFQNLFTTDAEKLGLAQKMVSDGFAELGIAVPASRAEFKKLVEGLDLSTESGRTLFAALMKLAPGFAAVEDAAEGLMQSFTQIASRRNGTLGRQFIEQDLEATVRTFMERNPWTAGMDWREVARQIGLITTYAGGREDFGRYSLEDQQLILKILGLQDDLTGLGDAAEDAGRGLADLGRSTAQAINAMVDAKVDLWNFLKSLYLDPELSPLDPEQQLGVAKSRFLETLGAAERGDVTAASSLPAIIEQVLNLGRTNFASGPAYTDLFNWITGLAGDFVQPGGGMDLQRLAFEEARSQTAQLTRQTNIMADVRALLIDIRDRGTAGDAAIAASVTNAALATERK